MRIHNDPVKGTALILTLIFILVLVLFALTVLLLAGSHYTATRSLFENENARRACESVAIHLVHRHNEGQVPAYFHDPQNWSGTDLKPFEWNGYRVNAYFQSAWNPKAANQLLLSIGRGRFTAAQRFEMRQRRLEDFAIYSDTPQQIPVPSLIDGLAFVNGKLELPKPVVRFRDLVQAAVTPAESGSFRRTSLEKWNYPSLLDLIRPELLEDIAREEGILVAGKDFSFWNGECYDIDLDQLAFVQESDLWETSYSGESLGASRSLFFYFDDRVCVRQSDRWPVFLPSTKLRAPIYIVSPALVQIESSIHSAESNNAYHPLCVISTASIELKTESRAVRLEAMLISMGAVDGNDEFVSLQLEPGERMLTEDQKTAWIEEIEASTFALEEEKKESIINSLKNHEKVIWFRGSVALTGKLVVAEEVTQLHFQSSVETYPVLPSLAFVYIVEGSRSWQ